MDQENNSNKKIYYYVGAIIIILSIVFLNQKGLLDGIGKSASAAVSGYWAKGANWVAEEIYPTISEEVQSRGETIENEIENEVDSAKENISENVLQKVGDYFSGIANSIVNPGSNNCQASDNSDSKASN